MAGLVKKARLAYQTRPVHPADPQYSALLRRVMHDSPNPNTNIDGVRHWLHVARTGHDLASRTAGADAHVAYLFGLLHDSQKRSRHDAAHPARAVQYAERLYKQKDLPVTPEQFQTLRYALAHHQGKELSEDPTIGAAWDADRVAVSRVGEPPRLSYFSTTAGKHLAVQTRHAMLREGSAAQRLRAIRDERVRALTTPAHPADHRHYRGLVHAVAAGAPLALERMHGIPHWLHVARTGHDLAARTAGADAHLAYLFGILHDARRVDDYSDREHPVRAVALARDLHRDGRLGLTDEQMARLEFAVLHHDDYAPGGRHKVITRDPAIGVAWDADRLALPRVGVIPADAMFSTEAGRQAGRALRRHYRRRAYREAGLASGAVVEDAGRVSGDDDRLVDEILEAYQDPVRREGRRRRPTAPVAFKPERHHVLTAVRLVRQERLSDHERVMLLRREHMDIPSEDTAHEILTLAHRAVTGVRKHRHDEHVAKLDARELEQRRRGTSGTTGAAPSLAPGPALHRSEVALRYGTSVGIREADARRPPIRAGDHIRYTYGGAAHRRHARSRVVTVGAGAREGFFGVHPEDQWVHRSKITHVHRGNGWETPAGRGVNLAHLAREETREAALVERVYEHRLPRDPEELSHQGRHAHTHGAGTHVRLRPYATRREKMIARAYMAKPSRVGRKNYYELRHMWKVINDPATPRRKKAHIALAGMAGLSTFVSPIPGDEIIGAALIRHALHVAAGRPTVPMSTHYLRALAAIGPAQHAPRPYETSVYREADGRDRLTLDFDGVIHDHIGRHGPKGGLIPGAETGIPRLAGQFNLACVTARRDIPFVEDFLSSHGLRGYFDSVGNTKLPSRWHVDDQGYHFHDWPSTMSFIDLMHPDRPVGESGAHHRKGNIRSGQRLSARNPWHGGEPQRDLEHDGVRLARAESPYELALLRRRRRELQARRPPPPPTLEELWETQRPEPSRGYGDVRDDPAWWARYDPPGAWEDQDNGLMTEAWAPRRARRRTRHHHGHIRVHHVTGDGMVGRELARFDHPDHLADWLDQGPQGDGSHIAVGVQHPSGRLRPLTRGEERDLKRRLRARPQQESAGGIAAEVVHAAASQLLPGYSTLPPDVQHAAGVAFHHHAGYAIHRVRGHRMASVARHAEKPRTMRLPHPHLTSHVTEADYARRGEHRRPTRRREHAEHLYDTWIHYTNHKTGNRIVVGAHDPRHAEALVASLYARGHHDIEVHHSRESLLDRPHLIGEAGTGVIQPIKVPGMATIGAPSKTATSPAPIGALKVPLTIGRGGTGGAQPGTSPTSTITKLNSHILLNTSAPAAVNPSIFPKPGTMPGGTSAPAVSQAQRQLIKLGMLQYGGAPTGTLNPATRTALKNFQHTYGLAGGGTLGQQTQAALHYYAGAPQ